MKIITQVTNEGVNRTVDFESARLPDGTDIGQTLKENKILKEKISQLREDFEFSKDIVEKALDKAHVPNKYKIWIKTTIDLIKLVK